MKRTNSLLGALLVLIIILFLGFVSQANAQIKPKITEDNGTMLVACTSVAIDSSGDTVYSNFFNPSKFSSESYYSYPPTSSFIQSATSGKPRITCTIEGSFDGVTVAGIVDTSGAVSDSSISYVYNTTVNFNDKHYPYYRFKWIGETGNRASAKRSEYLFFRRLNNQF